MYKRKNLLQIVKQVIQEKRDEITTDTTQDSLNFEKIYPNGIIKIDKDTYSKSILFSDVGYEISNDQDKTRIFTLYCNLINSFDSNVKVQFSFINQKIEQKAYKNRKVIDENDSELKKLQTEYFDFIQNQRDKGNNGIIKSKYITFTVKDDKYQNAIRRLETISQKAQDNLQQLGSNTYDLNGIERLTILNYLLNNGEKNYYDVSNLSDDIFEKNLEKDYIAPRVMDFNIEEKTSFRLGERFGSTMYFNVTSSELADRVLTEFLELDKEITISIHLRSLEQQKAIRMTKKKSSDLDSIKIKEQQKAILRGYDMDLMPTDLDPNRENVKRLLNTLKGEDEKYFYITFTVTILDTTTENLETSIYKLKSIAQNYSCEMMSLKYQQEKTFLSSLPLGNNLNEIELERGLNTTETAIFIPFTTQELYTENKANDWNLWLKFGYIYYLD